jgi:hypothetical protein
MALIDAVVFDRAQYDLLFLARRGSGRGRKCGGGVGMAVAVLLGVGVVREGVRDWSGGKRSRQGSSGNCGGGRADGGDGSWRCGSGGG